MSDRLLLQRLHDAERRANDERGNYEGAMADLDDLTRVAWSAVECGSLAGLRAYLIANYPSYEARDGQEGS